MNQPLALNPFKKGKKGEVEKIHKVNTEDSWLEETINQYDYLLKNKEELLTNKYRLFRSLDKVILENNQLNQFIDYFMNTPDVDPNCFFRYLTKLVQDSYEDGQNNFELNLQKVESYFENVFFTEVLKNFRGQPPYPLNIRLNGNISSHVATGARYCNVEIYGNVIYACGQDTNHCNFNIYGSAANHLGASSNNSSFTVKGDVGEHCGNNAKNCNFLISGSTLGFLGYEASNSHFTVEGNTDEYFGNEATKSKFILKGSAGVLPHCFGRDAKECKFDLHHTDTFCFVKDEIPRSNEIHLVDKNGKRTWGYKK